MQDSTHQPSRPLQPKATTRGQERILEYPAVKRRRPTVIACHHCRLKKIRCDGQRPACSSCAAKVVPCVYRDTTPGGRSSSRDSVPGVLQMLGQLRAAELVRVVGRLKHEADTETILFTIRSSLEQQQQQQETRRDSSSDSTSTTARGPRTPPDDFSPPLDDVAMGAVGGLDMNWLWPPCQPTATTTVDFTALGSVPEVVEDYWWPRPWTRLPNEF